MSDKPPREVSFYERLHVVNHLPWLVWLGGAFHVAGMPNNGFWDGVFWMWYIGRYIAHNFTLV